MDRNKKLFLKKYTSFALAIIGLSTSAALPALAANRYSYISYDPFTKAYGVVRHYPSFELAEATATNKCRESGSRNCQMAAWSRNACTALAVSPECPWGGSWGRSVFSADRGALNACYNDGGRHCRVVLRTCE